jgi:hypothetical protein
MSNDNEKVSVVTPSGKIVFIKNLFDKNDKERYVASLILKEDQDLSKIKKMMMDAAKARFDEKIYTSKKFKWGMKRPDEEAIEKYDFFDEQTYVVNASTKFDVEVKGINKGPDGKLEELIDGDLKAGDFCRFLISAYAWENTDQGVTRGVSLNLTAVQMVKVGEALYSRVASDSVFGEVELDIEVDAITSEETSSEAPIEGADAYDW